jgi:isoleucyl-tRNA synthetase
MDFKYEADTIRALARIFERGHVVRGFKPVHWCFDCGSALAEAEIEYHDKTSPAIDVAYDAIEPKALASRFGVDAGDAIVAVPIWTTTPWTLPASLAVTVGTELDYVLAEGPARWRRGASCFVVARRCSKSGKRYNVENAAVFGRARARGWNSSSCASVLSPRGYR